MQPKKKVIPNNNNNYDEFCVIHLITDYIKVFSPKSERLCKKNSLIVLFISN